MGFQGLPDDAITDEQQTTYAGLPADADPAASSAPAPTQKPSLLGQLGKGAVAGTYGLGTMVGGVTKLVGDVTGINPIAEAGSDTINYWNNKAQEYAGSVQSYKDINLTEDGGLHRLGEYAAYGVGQLLPTMAVSMTGGGLGARALAGVAAKSAVKKGVGEEVAKQMIGTAVKRGALAGAGASSYGMEVGSIYSDQAQDGKADPTAALLWGIPAAAMDVIPETRLLSKVPGFQALQQLPLFKSKEGSDWLVRGAKEALTQGGIEGATEFAQTLMEQKGALQDLNWEDAINAGLVGAIGGGVMGGGSGMLSKGASAKVTKPEADVLNAVADKVRNPDSDLMESFNADYSPIEPTATPIEQKAYSDLTPEEKYYADLNDGLVAPYSAPEATQQMVETQPGYNPEAPFADERAQRVEQQLASDQARLDAFDSANPVIPSPVEASAPFAYDYEGVKNHLESSQFFERGQKNGKPVTRSDFSAALQQSYPSLVGTSKGDVISALNAQIKGRKLTEKQQAVINKLDTDLDRHVAENRKAEIQAEQQRVLDQMAANEAEQRRTAFPFGYNTPGYDLATDTSKFSTGPAEPLKLYRGEFPYDKTSPAGGVVDGAGIFSKGVGPGDFWTTDKGTADYFAAAGGKRTDGFVREATLKPGAKEFTLVDAEGNWGPDAKRVWKEVTGSEPDFESIMQNGLGEYTQAFKDRGYDVVHSMDLDGPETLVLNKDALVETPKFSTTAAAPATLDLKTIQQSFPGQKVTATPDGHEVSLKNGSKVRVTKANEIQFNVADAEAGLGRKLKAGEKPVASWQTMPGGGVITLTEAGVGELDHEVFHTAMALALSKGERAAVLKKHGSEENAAVAYKNFRDANGKDSFFQKIKDFFLKVRDMFVKDADTVFRKLASGKAWEQATEGQRRDALAQMLQSAESAPESPAPETTPDSELEAKFSFGIDKMGKALATTKWGGKIDRIVSYFMPMDRIFDSFKERADLAPIKDQIGVVAKEYELQTAVQDDHQTEAGLRLNKAFAAIGNMTKVGGADVWYKQDEAKAKQLNSVMQKGRLWGFSADKELAEQDWSDETWEAGGMKTATGLSLKAAFAQFKAEYNKMTPEMQAAYLSLRDFNKESRDDIIKIRERIIGEMTSLSDETRANLIEKIRKQFEKVKGDYFTLGRMGEYVVSIKTADQVDAEGNIVKRGETVASARYNDKADYLKAAEMAVADPLSFAQALPGARADLGQKGDLVAVYMHAPAQSRLQANIPQQFIEKLKGLVSGIEMKDLRKELRAIQRDLTKGIEEGKIAVPDGVTEVMARLAKAETHQAMEQAQKDLETLLGNHAQEQALLGEVHAAIDAAGMTAEIAEALKEDFDQAYLAALPETSIMKNYVKSKNLPGFNEDMLHSFAVYHQKFARTKAFATHGRKISDGLALMEKRGMGKDKAFTGEITPEQSAAIGEFAKLVRDRQQAVLTEKVSPAIRKLTKFPFLWYMTSPSVLLVQSTQPFTVTHPFLAARFGQSKSMAAIMKAYQRQFKQEFTDDKLLAFNEQHRELIRKLKDVDTTRGQTNEMVKGLSEKDREMLAMALTPSLNISLSHEEMEFAMSGETPNNRVAEKLGLFMSVSEAASRKAGFLASFGLKYQATGDFAASLDLGTESVRQTLFSYSQANRPAILTGSGGRFFGQFQIFRLQMLSHIAKLAQDSVWFNNLSKEERSQARRELTTLLAMHFVVGGAMGVPIVSNMAVLFMKAVHGLWGDDDEPYDAEEELKKALGDGAAAKGIGAWVGMDLSKRVGAGGIASLFQSKPPERAKGAELAGWYAMQLAGPTFSTLANTYVTAGEAFETGDWSKALAKVGPKLIRDPMRAVQMYNEGVVTAGGKTVIPAEDLNIYQVGLAFLGVNPLEMSLKSEEAGRVSRYSAQVSERRALLVSKFAEAVLDGDQEDVDKAVDRVIKFNESMPAYGLKASDLLAGAKKRQMDKMGIDSKAVMKNNMFFGDEDASTAAP